MALNKKITNDKGIETSYHKVGNVTINNSDLSFCLNSYASTIYRNLDKPADFSYYYFNISLEEEESMGIRALCYNKLKTLSNWADAEDC